MALNYRRWSFERDRFDDVGIERSLPKETGAAEEGGFSLEDIDKRVADDTSLLLGIEHAGEPLEKKLASIDHFEIDPEAMGERLFHPLAFTRAQQRVIDEDAF